MDDSIKTFALLAMIIAPVTVMGATLRYEPATVQLSGTVRMEKHYGPPNFGANPRTDVQVTVPVLVLDGPIDVEAERIKVGDPMPLNGTSYRGVSRLQLVPSGPTSVLVQYDGKHVAVSGSLFQKVSAQNYTDVLLSVGSVRLTGR